MQLINTFLNLAKWAETYNENRRNKKSSIPKRVFGKLVKLACIIAIETICRNIYVLQGKEPKPLDSKSDAPIVSLTTFPARINKLWLVLYSMFNQTVRPSKIIVNLTKEEFPEGRTSLPKSLLRMEKLGVEIVFLNYNLKPHNKYYHALSAVKDKPVITVDDDLFYWQDTIERLCKLYQEHPTRICANKGVRLVKQDSNIEFMQNAINVVGHDLMAQGVFGILYPPSFRPDSLFNRHEINELALINDDNWLKAQEMINNVEVIVGDYFPHPLMLLGSQTIALWKSNITDGRSKRIMTELIVHFNLQNKL